MKSSKISSPYSIQSFPETGKFLDLFPDCIIPPIKFSKRFTPEIW